VVGVEDLHCRAGKTQGRGVKPRARTLVLKPGKEKSLLRRHPWVFSGAITRAKAVAGPTDTIHVQGTLTITPAVAAITYGDSSATAGGVSNQGNACKSPSRASRASRTSSASGSSIPVLPSPVMRRGSHNLWTVRIRSKSHREMAAPASGLFRRYVTSRQGALSEGMIGPYTIRMNSPIPLFRRCFAECFGTFWLVFGGCGSAVLAAGFPGLGIGFAGVALAFGMTVLTMA